MSAIVHNLANGVIVPQPDFSASEDGTTGWQASQSFIVRKGQWDNFTVRTKFALGNGIAVLDPNVDEFFRFLTVEKIKDVQTQPGGLTKVSVDFVGVYNGDPFGHPSGDSLPTYSLHGTLKSVPIQEHPKFKALSSSERISLNLIANGKREWWPTVPGIDKAGVYLLPGEDGEQERDLEARQLTSEDAIEFANLIYTGIDTYEVSTYTWSKRYSSKFPLTAAQLNALGKITTAPGSPPVPQNRNWLLVSASQEQYGAENPTYTIALDWLLSEQDGWDEFLYELTQ